MRLSFAVSGPSFRVGCSVDEGWKWLVASHLQHIHSLKVLPGLVLSSTSYHVYR